VIGRSAIPQPLDWTRAEDWAARVAKGQLDAVRTAFRKNGAHGPDVIWSPSAEQVGAPPLRALLEYWSALKRDDGLPQVGAVDPLGMRSSLGYVMLVDAVDGGHDFRYRLFGSAVAAVSGFDMTRQLLSEHPASTHILEFALALYRAAMRRREAVFSQYAPSGTLMTAQWQRIAFPLAGSSGDVVRFLAGTVPVGRDGRIVATRF
jgi:hypothetical protein